MAAAAIGQSSGLPTPTLAEALLILIAGPVGQLTHELAHYVAAWCIGAEPQLNLRVSELMDVTYDENIGVRNELVIGLAPTTSGMLGATLIIVGFGWPAPSYVTVALALAWLFHTLPSEVDLAGLRQYTGPATPLEEWERSMWKGLLAMLLSGWVNMLPYPPGPVFYLLSIPLAAAGLAMLTFAIYEYDQADGRRQRQQVS